MCFTFQSLILSQLILAPDTTMCELLGMCANAPTDIRFSFAGLARRGGDTGPHVDGWGIAFHEGKTAQVFHDHRASAISDLARFVSEHAIKSYQVIAHVRKANRGKVCLENTHPFTRVLWGRVWTFAHNGQLNGYRELELGIFTPIGNTDSERAFCWMMSRLAETFERMPSIRQLDREIAALCGQLRKLGVFNMMLGDGRTLYAYCDKRLAYVTRRSPFGIASLIDEDRSIDFSHFAGGDDVVTVVATRPLTADEEWTTIPPRTLIAFRHGEIGASITTAAFDPATNALPLRTSPTPKRPARS